MVSDTRKATANTKTLTAIANEVVLLGFRGSRHLLSGDIRGQ